MQYREMETTQILAIENDDYINEAMEDDAIEDEAIKNEAIEDEAIKNEAIEDEAIKNEAIEDEAIKNEAIEDEAIKNEAIEDENELTFTAIKLKQRSSVEFNCMELVCAMVLLHRSINNFNDLIEYLSNIESDKPILKLNSDTDFYEYMKDIHKKKKIINNYIVQFKISIEPINSLLLDNIEKMYISGKINKHLEINELNSKLCKLETKSDVYLKLKDNIFIGLSVKQTKTATKSNYSVQKILGKETDELLTEIKKNFLKEQGFPKFNKSERNKVNPLFYQQNKENPYMNKLKEEIENNKEMISKFLIEKLNCSNINYDIYEFDGTKLTKLVKVSDMSEITFEEYLPYYYKKTGEEKKTAKLFYRLTCDDKKYRVEIRWKGNIHSASPQFLMHEE